MFKFLLLFVICSLCLLHVHAQSREDREFCERLNRECLRHERATGQRDETTNLYNQYCRRELSGSWRDITRCQLVTAGCVLTLLRCTNLTCPNVASVVRN